MDKNIFVNNPHIKTYTVYDEIGNVLAKYVRNPTSRDVPATHNEKGETVSPPTYYGEWTTYNRAAIDGLNEERKKNKKIIKRSEETVYEKNLRIAKERLMRLLAEEKEKEEE